MVLPLIATAAMTAYSAYAASQQQAATGTDVKLSSKEIRRLGRAQFQSVPGAATTLAGMESLLDQARNTPTDPGLEAQIVAAIRQQAGAGVGAGGPQTPAGLGLGRGLSQQAVGAAISGTDAIRTSRFLQRFQAQQSVLQGLAGLTQGGFKGGPVEALVNERAMLQATQMRIDAEQGLSRSKMLLSGAGTAISALAAPKPGATPGATTGTTPAETPAATPMPTGFLPEWGWGG